MTTKVTFQLPAAYAANVSEGIILGEFNNWNPEQATPLVRNEDGSLVAEISLAAGRTYQYRYFLSDGRWVNDNSNTTWVELYGGYVENCVIEVPIPEASIPVENKSPEVKKAVAKKAVVKVKPVADDFSRLNGITKKLAALLHKAGIRTYKDLAKSTIKNLDEILASAGEHYKVIDASTWPKQAKLAASGNWEALEQLKPTPRKKK